MHSWCSGNIGSSHGLAPGSTPGGCIVEFRFCECELVGARHGVSLFSPLPRAGADSSEFNITCSSSTALSSSNYVTRLLDYYEKIQTDNIPMHNAVPAAHHHGVEFGKIYSWKTNILECIAACLYSGSSAQHTRSVSHLGSKRIHRNRKCSFLTVPVRRPEPMSSCHVVSVSVSSSDILSLLLVVVML